MINRDITLGAGDKDQIVTLLAPTLVTDSFGQRTAYAISFGCAAKVEPLAGREFFAAGTTESPASVRVLIEYRVEPAANWRLDWNGGHYELVAAPMDLDARHRTLELMCREVAK